MCISGPAAPCTDTTANDALIFYSVGHNRCVEPPHGASIFGALRLSPKGAGTETLSKITTMPRQHGRTHFRILDASNSQLIAYSKEPWLTALENARCLAIHV